jgi:hypothetical protein
MSQSPSAQITIDQLRNREIIAADLLNTAGAQAGARTTAISAPSEPLSRFGRKLAGHDA